MRKAKEEISNTGMRKAKEEISASVQTSSSTIDRRSTHTPVPSTPARPLNDTHALRPSMALESSFMTVACVDGSKQRWGGD